jgi:outer membrane protein assembly factor BamB
VPFCFDKDWVDGSAFNPCGSHVVSVPLTKISEWRFDAKAPIEGFPVAVGDNICFGTRNGGIFCVRQETGDVVWTFVIPGNMDFAGGLGLWNNILYFGCFDGRVYALDAETGKPALLPFQASPELWPIKCAVSPPNQKGVIVSNSDKKLLSAFSLATGQAAWSIPFPTTPVLGQPLAYQANIYVVTGAGELLEIDHQTGQISRRFQVDQEFTTPGAMVAGRYFVASPKGKLHSIDIRSGRTIWTQDCGEPVASPPTVDSDWILLPTATERVFCYSTEGDLRWKQTFRDIIGPETDGIIFRNRFYIGTKKGFLLCMDAHSGQTVWQFATDGSAAKEPKGVLSRGLISKGGFFIGSEDHGFYCLSVE